MKTLRATALTLVTLAISAITPAAAIAQTPVPLVEVAENFELVGHDPLMNRGMNAALAVHGDYAYVGSRTDGKPWGTDENLLNAGVMVVDVSDPAAPEVVNQIGPPHEGLQDQTSREMRVWHSEELLIVENLASNCSELIHECAPVGGSPDVFTFYDISGDRGADPEFVANYDPSVNPHEFFLWEDPFVPGRALLFISATSSDRLLVTDISNARDGAFEELTSWPVPVPSGDLHSMSISNDGMRAYLADLTGGFLVADTSDLANGVADPQIELVTPNANRVSWPGPGAHSALKLWGRDVAFVADEVYGEALASPVFNPPHGCPWGWVRTIDISDPVAPALLGEYRLAQNEESYCDSDPPRATASYSAHNPTLTPDIGFITWHSGGLQAIDLDDPAAPTQAGVFSPMPEALAVTEDPALSSGPDKVVMWSFPIIQDGLLYVVDVRNGLYILRYTGEDADAVSGIAFLEGNSNLGDALAFEQPDPCDRDPVPAGYDCEATGQL